MGHEGQRNERTERWRDTSWEEKGIYEDGLPPPSKKLEVVTVVPVYREFSEGTLWRLIEDAANQNAPSETFEILLVVNNSESEAHNETDAYLDNQKLLYFLGILRSAITSYTEDPRPDTLQRACEAAYTLFSSAGIELTEQQQEIFKKAVQKQVRVYGIDASSEERTAFDSDDHLNPIGVARHIGSKVAARRYLETNAQENGLIDFVDADCGFPPNYYKQLAETGKKNPESGAFAKEVRTYAPNIPEWKTLSPLQRLSALTHFLRQNITYRRDLYGNTGTHWAPQPMVRVSLLKKVGGYTYDTHNEDIYFGTLISFESRPKQVVGTHVRLSDRESDRGADGRKWLWSNGTDSTDAAAFAKAHDPRHISNLGGAEYGSFSNNVLQRDAQYETDPKYRAIRTERWKLEVEKSKKRVETLRIIVREVVHKITKIRPNLDTFIKDKNYHAWLKKHFGKSLSPEILHYLGENPIIMAAMVTATKMLESESDRESLGIDAGSTEEMAWSFFEKYLPEFFLALPDQEPDYSSLRTAAKSGMLPEGTSLRYFAHLIGAQHEYIATTR